VKRLIDEEYAPGSSESLLAELVRATPPFELAALERRRVFDLGTVAARRPGAFSVRIGATVLLLGSAAAAAVTVEHSRTGAHSDSPVVMASASALPVVTPTAVEPVSPIGVEAPAPPVAPRASSDAPSTRLKTVARPTSTSFRQGEDPAPVLEAIRALRSQGDAARAGVLLAEYLKAHPHSVLSEDALALSIESAVARHDMRAANDFSRRYLAQFPNGRYRAFALRATAP
jgi:hypothetical protein